MQEGPLSPEETPRYPKLTPEQIQRVLAELQQEYQWHNLRPQAKGYEHG